MSYKAMREMGYVGPDGPHLAHTTKYTREGVRNDKGTMHPTGRHHKLHLRRDGKTPITAPRKGK